MKTWQEKHKMIDGKWYERIKCVKRFVMRPKYKVRYDDNVTANGWLGEGEAKVGEWRKKKRSTKSDDSRQMTVWIVWNVCRMLILTWDYLPRRMDKSLWGSFKCDLMIILFNLCLISTKKWRRKNLLGKEISSNFRRFARWIKSLIWGIGTVWSHLRCNKCFCSAFGHFPWCYRSYGDRWAVNHPA